MKTRFDTSTHSWEKKTLRTRWKLTTWVLQCAIYKLFLSTMIYKCNSRKKVNTHEVHHHKQQSGENRAAVFYQRRMEVIRRSVWVYRTATSLTSSPGLQEGCSSCFQRERGLEFLCKSLQQWSVWKWSANFEMKGEGGYSVRTSL